MPQNFFGGVVGANSQKRLRTTALDIGRVVSSIRFKSVAQNVYKAKGAITVNKGMIA